MSSLVVYWILQLLALSQTYSCLDLKHYDYENIVTPVEELHARYLSFYTNQIHVEEYASLSHATVRILFWLFLCSTPIESLAYTPYGLLLGPQPTSFNLLKRVD